MDNYLHITAEQGTKTTIDDGCPTMRQHTGPLRSLDSADAEFPRPVEEPPNRAEYPTSRYPHVKLAAMLAVLTVGIVAQKANESGAESTPTPQERKAEAERRRQNQEAARAAKRAERHAKVLDGYARRNRARMDRNANKEANKGYN